jgi:hypothetical protein
MSHRRITAYLLAAALLVAAATPAAAAVRGRNRLTIPALHISSAVRGYGCALGGAAAGLGPGVYRWGCNDPSNTYLMSHAWSTFAALRRAYRAKALRPGLVAAYAGPDGVVRRYRLAWVRRVRLAYFNATHEYWATAATARPSLTLQTCDGVRSEYRIIVRFELAG